MHDLPVDLTEETLSFFAVYMAHHINPKSVNNYLTGIVQQLESMLLKSGMRDQRLGGEQEVGGLRGKRVPVQSM